jgi:hypothetical protein
MSLRITCINKDSGNHDNPHEAISRYGWLNEISMESGKSTRQEMVEWVEKGNTAYVKDANGNTAKCGVRTSKKGTKFLQTYSDGFYSDNLLSLSECK